MRILFLAPQPFFQERGTPIAVRLALKVLSERKSDSIDLLTFAEGDNVDIENVKIYRIWSPSVLRGVRPGFSIKKLFCDAIFFCKAVAMILRANFQGRPYALIHAVEESVFMALIFRWTFRIPYIYDMDSSLAMQLVEKLPALGIFKKFFEWLEACAIRSSLAVIPVCDALAVIAQSRMAQHIQILPDISLDAEHSESGENAKLSEEAKLSEDVPIVLYVGNLEHYQGVELLIDSFASLNQAVANWHLVIIGGNKFHIDQYGQKISKLGLEDRIHLLGSRPVSLLSFYLKQATILASPRILGNNTPMKIYSYMHSGVAIIATNLPTHTQVLNERMAKLVEPSVGAFSSGLKDLFSSPELRMELARNAFEEADTKYTFPVFRKTLLGIYEQVEQRIGRGPSLRGQ